MPRAWFFSTASCYSDEGSRDTTNERSDDKGARDTTIERSTVEARDTIIEK